MKVLRLAVVAVAAATMVSAAYASDFNFGSYARSISMGGAGLALTDDPTTSSVVNPAAGAASGVKFQFIMPGLDFHTRGASIGDLRSKFSEISGGGDDDAIKLAETFGKAPTTLSAGVVTGFAGVLGVSAEGEAQGIITPGAAFSEWVDAGLPRNATDLADAVLSGKITNTALVTAITDSISGGTITSASDIANAFVGGTNVQARLVYAVPSVNWSFGVPAKNSGKLWIGARMRWLQSETHTWAVQQDPGVTDRISLQAVEDLSKTGDDSGFGADLGLIYQPKHSIAQWGMVINNFLDPKLTGIQTPRMLSVGMSSQPRARFRYAIDLVNINKAYNETTKLRMGAEWLISNSLVLRAGNSGEGWTYGFGIGGLNFAFSNDAPNMISRVLRF